MTTLEFVAADRDDGLRDLVCGWGGSAKAGPTITLSFGDAADTFDQSTFPFFTKPPIQGMFLDSEFITGPGGNITVAPTGTGIKRVVAPDTFQVDNHAVDGFRLTNLRITANADLVNFAITATETITYNNPIAFGGVKLGNDEINYAGPSKDHPASTITLMGFIGETAVGETSQTVKATLASSGGFPFEPNPATDGKAINLAAGTYVVKEVLTIGSLAKGDSIVLNGSAHVGAMGVPEPSTLTLVGVGGMTMLAGWWFRHLRPRNH